MMTRAGEQMHDGELLQAFCDEGAQWAFDELRQRHLSLVYSTARRELGDPDLAKDVAQIVFLLLIRKARQLRGSRSLAGWLFQTTRLAARNARQQETRRQRREQEAQQMQHSQVLERRSEAEMWASIEPHLHEAMSTLSAKERHAVLLRLFENLPAPEVAQQLGISPNAAQMRVSRGVEKLRRFLLKRGLPIGGAVLSALLAEQAVQAAPLTLMAATAAGSASAAGAVSSRLIEGVMHMMKINAWKAVALRLGVAAVVVGSAGGAVALRRSAAVARPDSPAVGTWRKGALIFVLSSDGTGQELAGRTVNPLRWTEQEETVTVDVSEPNTPEIEHRGHLSPDKRTLTITETGGTGFLSYTRSSVNWVLARQ